MPNRDKTLSEMELDEIRRRSEAATLGPWRSFIEGRDHTSGSSFIMTGTDTNRGEDIELSGASAADHDFIAHARQDVPRLLEEIMTLRNLCEHIQQMNRVLRRIARERESQRDRLTRDKQSILEERRQLQKRLTEIDREFDRSSTIRPQDT